MIPLCNLIIQFDKMYKDQLTYILLHKLYIIVIIQKRLLCNAILLHHNPEDYQRDRILEGMRHWEDNTCIRFKERTTEVDYIVFYKGSW